MPPSESQFQLVNRRIAAVRFHLSLLEDDKIQSHPLEQKACIDAALFNLYYILLHYINELAESYRQPLVASSPLNLEAMINELKGGLADTQAFKELEVLLKEGLWVQLGQLPGKLLMGSSDQKPELRNNANNDDELLTLIDVSHVENLFSADAISSLLSSLEALIDRQRSDLIEY